MDKPLETPLAHVLVSCGLVRPTLGCGDGAAATSDGHSATATGRKCLIERTHVHRQWEHDVVVCADLCNVDVDGAAGS